MTNISMLDVKYLKQTIAFAKDAFAKGNYPVGAILTINNRRIGHQENQIVTKKSWVQHAESQLIIKNGEEVKKAADSGLKIILYSSLEPCLMCLGTATMNKVSKIVYIQKDLHGGACNLDISNLGARYPDIFPEIIEARISETPKRLIIKFLKKQLISGNKEWAKKSLPLFMKA